VPHPVRVPTSSVGLKVSCTGHKKSQKRGEFGWDREVVKLRNQLRDTRGVHTLPPGGNKGMRSLEKGNSCRGSTEEKAAAIRDKARNGKGGLQGRSIGDRTAAGGVDNGR